MQEGDGDEDVIVVEADAVTLTVSTANKDDDSDGTDTGKATQAVALPPLSGDERKQVMVTGNRLIELPSTVTHKLYVDLACRVNRDEIQGYDMLVVRGNNDLAAALVLAIDANRIRYEHGLRNTGTLSGPHADLLALQAAATGSGDWIVFIEPDDPHSWLRGWVPVPIALRELKRQVAVIEAGIRQMELEVL
jgi:hypothetical protein